MLQTLMLMALTIGTISAAKTGDKICKIHSLVAYMDEGCTLMYRNVEAMKKSREEVDRFNEAALYTTG